MPQTQIATGRAFTYLDNLGRIGGSSTTFWHPCGLGRGENDVLYVLNWGNEFNPSTRITKCTLTTQEFLLDIGSRGDGDGEFEWPGGLAVDSQENLHSAEDFDDAVKPEPLAVLRELLSRGDFRRQLQEAKTELTLIKELMQNNFSAVDLMLDVGSEKLKRKSYL